MGRKISAPSGPANDAFNEKKFHTKGVTKQAEFSPLVKASAQRHHGVAHKIANQNTGAARKGLNHGIGRLGPGPGGMVPGSANADC